MMASLAAALPRQQRHVSAVAAAAAAAATHTARQWHAVAHCSSGVGALGAPQHPLTARAPCARRAMSTVVHAPRVKRVTVEDIAKRKADGVPITMLTAYDVTMAEAMNDVVDMILVGDSVAMVVLGHDTTTGVDMADMVRHAAAVARGARRPLLVADMPFGSYASVGDAVANAHVLIKAGGAHAVKLEGGVTQASKIRAIVAEGIPVVAHIGLTPQTATLSSGYRVQGRGAAEAMRLVDDALAVASAGAFAVVLEKVPAQLAAFLTPLLPIPTIGIGAGPACDGQVLVAHDVLGLFPRMVPKFARQYANLLAPMTAAFAQYCDDVVARRFPPPLPPTAASPLASAAAADDAAPLRAPQPNSHRYDMSHAEAAAFAVEVQRLRATPLPPPSPLPPPPLPPLLAVDGSAVAAALAALRAAAPAAAVRRDGTPLSHHVGAAAGGAAARDARRGRAPRVAIIGSGALASVLAARLAAHGSVDVTMFTRDAGAVAAVRTHGICVQAGAGGAVAPGVPCPIVDLATWPQFGTLLAALRGAPPPAAAPAAAAPAAAAHDLHATHAGTFDAVLLANKATNAVSALAAAALLVAPATAAGGGGVVIPLYNGGFTLEYGARLFTAPDGVVSGAARDVVAAALAGVAPWQLAYGVTYHAASAPAAPAASSAAILRGTAAVRVAAARPHVVHASEGVSLLTAVQPAADAPLRAVAAALSAAGVHTSVIAPGQAAALRASKVAVNAILNPLAALTGVRNGDALTVASRRPAFVAQLAAEVASAIAPHVPAMQAHVPGCAGFDGSAEECVARAMRAAAATADNTSSMLADAQRGRVCEAQFINGWVAATLAAAGAVDDAATTVHARLLRHFNDRDALLFADAAALAAAREETAVIMRALRVPAGAT